MAGGTSSRLAVHPTTTTRPSPEDAEEADGDDSDLSDLSADLSDPSSSCRVSTALLASRDPYRSMMAESAPDTPRRETL